MWPGIDRPARVVSWCGMRLWPRRDFSGNRSVSARPLGGKRTWMGTWRRKIGSEWAKTAHCARVSVGVVPCSGVYRWWKGGDLWGLGDDDCRVSVRYTLGPTTARPRRIPEGPARTGCGPRCHACINDAWGMRLKAAPGGQGRPNRQHRGSGNRRRRERLNGAAAERGAEGARATRRRAPATARSWCMTKEIGRTARRRCGPVVAMALRRRSAAPGCRARRLCLRCCR